MCRLHNGGLQTLQSAEDVAINWLEGAVIKALAK